MTLYLKYRGQTINEIDITSVRESLTNILKSGSIPHTFLFAGPKGTGKTSLARILAKAINCDSKNPPCNKCEQCVSITNGTNIDVIEMDAASNRGIDDVRALRDIVKLAPASAKAKVYIIDEAHMLTAEASNALLKTLEEPPSHVYFILATTNPEKLIATIKSRTTLVQFTKATDEEVERALKRVVEGEKIKISKEDVGKIVKIAKGSFRDAVKSLEQYTHDASFLKTTSSDVGVSDFIDILLKKDQPTSLNAIKGITDYGDFTDQVLETLHERLIKTPSHELVQLIELLLESREVAKLSPIEELPLEIAIIKWCNIIRDTI